jgi:hypothetical protein
MKLIIQAKNIVAKAIAFPSKNTVILVENDKERGQLQIIGEIDEHGPEHSKAQLSFGGMSECSQTAASAVVNCIAASVGMVGKLTFWQCISIASVTVEGGWWH